jgi:hypothetical protein
MPWTYVGVSSVATAASGNLTLTVPAGVQEGDLLVAIISYRSNASFTSPGAPWVSVTSQNTGNTTANATTSIGSGHMFYCVRGASDPGLTFTRTAGDVALGRIVAYRNNNRSSNVLVTSTSTTLAAAATAVSVTGLTTANARDLVVFGFCGARSTSATNFDAATDPTTTSGTASNETGNPAEGDWQERCDSGTTTGADATLAIADALRATAGATGNLTVTAGASARHVVVAAAFKEVPDRLLTANVQSFSVAGVTTPLSISRSLTANLQSFSVAGVTTPLAKGRPLSASAQSFSVYSDAATPLNYEPTTVFPNPYDNYTEQSYDDYGATRTYHNAPLLVSYTLTALQQSYSVSTVSTGIRADRRLTATQQSYSVSPVTTALRVTRSLVANLRTYAVSGVAASIRAERRLSGTLQTVSVSGVSVNLRASRLLSSTVQAFLVDTTASSFTITQPIRLTALVGAYSVTGNSVVLTYGRPPRYYIIT